MQPSDERAALHELLARGDVREQMQSMGVDPVAAAARIDRLSDTEVAELQAQLHTAPAGGVSVIGAALVVFLVLVFTDVIGATDIFPFIRPVKR
jgi:hypothetical protein